VISDGIVLLKADLYFQIIINLSLTIDFRLFNMAAQKTQWNERKKNHPANFVRRMILFKPNNN